MKCAYAIFEYSSIIYILIACARKKSFTLKKIFSNPYHLDYLIRAPLVQRASLTLHTRRTYVLHAWYTLHQGHCSISHILNSHIQANIFTALHCYSNELLKRLCVSYWILAAFDRLFTGCARTSICQYIQQTVMSISLEKGPSNYLRIIFLCMFFLFYLIVHHVWV